MSGGFDATSYFYDLFAVVLIAIPAFYLCRGALARKLVWILSGVVLIAAIAPRLAFFYLLYWMLIPPVWSLLDRVPQGLARRVAFFSHLIALLAPMVAWKLLGDAFVGPLNKGLADVLWAFSPTLGQLDAIRDVFIPVGLSFATFRALDLAIQRYLGLLDPPAVDVLAYGLFPCVLVTGPICQFKELDLTGIARTRADAEDFSIALQRIVLGLVKLFILAKLLAPSVVMVTQFEALEVPLILALVAFAWYFYFNFSGYADLAIGFARLFGVRLEENFHYPYLQRNLQLFWANWHMSLTRFAQRNVFVPAGGMRARTQYRAVVATMMTIALWHDLSLSLVIFGIYHSLGLIVLRLLGNRKWSLSRLIRNETLARTTATGITFVYVLMSFPLLVISTDRLAAFYSSLFGWSA